MRPRTLIAVLLTLSCLGSAAICGSSIQAEEAMATEDDEALPGVELAKTVAIATGIAITPLLGVSAVGAWEYYHADASLRAELPWYTSQWFWIPGLLVALLLVFKDPLPGRGEAQFRSETPPPRLPAQAKSSTPACRAARPSLPSRVARSAPALIASSR